MPATKLFDRNQAESSTNNRALALVVGSIAATMAGVFWFNGRVQTTRGLANDSDSHQSESIESPSDSVDERSEVPSDWNRRLLVLEDQIRALPGETVSAQFDLVQQEFSKHGDEMSPHSNQGADVIQELAKIQSQLRTLHSSAAEPNQNVDDIESKLDFAVAEIARRDQVERNRAIQLARLKVKQQFDPKIRDIQLRIRDEEDAIAGIHRKIATDGKRKGVAADKNARAMSMQRDMPAIRTYLSPFITPGYVQPLGSSSDPLKTVRTVEPTPVSLSRLQRTGALHPTTAGLTLLYRIGGEFSVDQNVRPLGGFPKYQWNGELKKTHVLNAVREAQQLLRAHGAALVEAGMLSP